MSLFDVLFPEIATASHLRSIAENSKYSATQARIRNERASILAKAKTQSNEKRIEALELELGKTTLLIEALLEILEESGTISRDQLAKRILEIDALDGVLDGQRISKQKEKFDPKRSTEDYKTQKLHFPES